MKLVISIVVYAILFAAPNCAAFAQEKTQPAKGAAAVAKATAAEPTVDEILDKHLQALGGRQAWEKITSRVTKGTIEASSMGLKGELEVYSKARSKSLMIQKITGMGEILDGCDGKIAWTQNPMMGLREKSGAELAAVVRESGVHAAINIRPAFSRLELKGKEKVGDREAYVILATPAEGSPVKMFFDTQTGFMTRAIMDIETPQGKFHIETTRDDYREVDGVKIAFTTRVENSMGRVVIKLTEVKHNVEIDDAKFNKPSGQ
jgi:hypothetical protein